MNPLESIMATMQDTTFRQPITLRARQQAQQFAALHVNPAKVRQVYLNTLAVQAVASYLTYFGFPLELTAGDSWQPPLQALADVADLRVRGWGVLECRPVLPGATQLQIPPEVQGDRAGYVAVQFDRDLRTATLLGFGLRPSQGVIALRDLRSLEELLDYLSQPLPVARLRTWLQGAITEGWQSLENLALPTLEPAISFRSATLASVKPTRVRCAKVLHLSRAEEQMALVVGITPPAQNGRVQTADEEFEISVDVCPLAASAHLPADLQIQVLDAVDTLVMHASAQGSPAVSLEFTGEAEEVFQVRLQLGEVAVTETFTI